MELVIPFKSSPLIVILEAFLYTLICALEGSLVLSSKKTGKFQKESQVLALILTNTVYQQKEFQSFSTQVTNTENINIS